MRDTIIRLSRFLITVMAIGVVVLCPHQASHAAASKVFYSVQVGAFKRLANARVHAADVGRREQRPCFVEKADIPGKGVWYRVYLGNFAHPDDARSYRECLKTGSVIDYGAIRKFSDAGSLPAGSDVATMKRPKAAPYGRVPADGSGSGKIATPDTRAALFKKHAPSSVAETAELSGPGETRLSMTIDERVDIFWNDAEKRTFRLGTIDQRWAGNQVSCVVCRRYEDPCSADAYPADYDEEAWLNPGSGGRVLASGAVRITPRQWSEISVDAWQETGADEKVRTHKPPAENHLLESILVKLGFTTWSFVTE